MTKTEAELIKKLLIDGVCYVTNKTEAKAADNLIDAGIVTDEIKEHPDGRVSRILSPQTRMKPLRLDGGIMTSKSAINY